MRFLVLGDTSRLLDEGAKNVASNLTREIASRHEVLSIYQRKLLSPINLWHAIRFKPHLVLSVQGPSAKTVGLLFLLKLVCRSSRTAAIGAQPVADASLFRALRWFGPDLLFAQSQRWHDRFAATGVPVSRLGNGVDIHKFKAVADGDALAALRADLGLAPGKKVALHIGPLNRNRNHELLIRLQREGDWQVLVVGSTTAPFVPEVEAALVDAGVIVARRYFEDINLVYGLADVYVFPVTDPNGSIEFPLTVLEAMACDKPVVSTRFLALPEYLDEGPAFAYFDGSFECLNASLARVAGRTGNRERAKAFAWDLVVTQLEAEFTDVRA